MRNREHLDMRTLMASVTRTSGGSTPDDSTVTREERGDVRMETRPNKAVVVAFDPKCHKYTAR